MQVELNDLLETLVGCLQSLEYFSLGLTIHNQDMTKEHILSCALPCNTHTLLIHSYKKVKFNLAISFNRFVELDLTRGLNTICICNIFKLAYEFRESLGDHTLCFFTNDQPSSLQMFNTHHPSNTILLILAEIGTENTLEHLSRISFLRKGKFTEEKKALELLSAPIRELITKGRNFCGEVETLNHLPRGPVTIEEEGPVNLGLWFWTKEPTCFKKCCPLLSETETFVLSTRPSNRFPFPWNLLSESQLFPKGSNREVDPTQPITDTFTSRALVWTI